MSSVGHPTPAGVRCCGLLSAWDRLNRAPADIQNNGKHTAGAAGAGLAGAAAGARGGGLAAGPAARAARRGRHAAAGARRPPAPGALAPPARGLALNSVACKLWMGSQQQRLQCVSVRADDRPALDDRQQLISSTYNQCGTGCLGVAVLCSEDPNRHHAGNGETWHGHFCAEVSLCLLGGNRLRLNTAAHIRRAMRTLIQR